MDNKPRPYLHTITAGVTLPLLQAGVTGAVCALVGLGVSLWLRWRSWPLVSLGAGVISFAAAWFYLGRHWLNLTGLERLTGLDLNGDGRIGLEPSPLSAREEVRVYVAEVRSDGHLSGNQKVYDLPCDSKQLAELARGILGGLPFSERLWTGAGRPFSIVAFRDLRGELIRRGLIRLASTKDARQGYTLTLAGKHVLTGVLAELPPSPAEGEGSES